MYYDYPYRRPPRRTKANRDLVYPNEWPWPWPMRRRSYALLKIVFWAIVAYIIGMHLYYGPKLVNGAPNLPTTRVVIGVWQQPASTMDTWKSRGINTIVTEASKPQDEPLANYITAIKAKNLKLWLGVQSSPNLTPSQARDVEAFMLQDEPENWPKVVKRPDGSFDWVATIAKYQQSAASTRFNFPDHPIYGNFNGGPLLSAREVSSDARNPTLGHYRNFLQAPDIVSADFYVAATGRPNSSYPQNVGVAIDRLATLSGNKLSLSFIETANQGLTNPGARHPSPEDIRASVWISMIHGAKGIVYFPLKVQGGFAWDNTPASNAAAITQVNSELVLYQNFILNGALTRTGESGKWIMPDSSFLQVTPTYQNGKWDVAITSFSTQTELERLKQDNATLRQRLEKIKQWHQNFPQN